MKLVTNMRPQTLLPLLVVLTTGLVLPRPEPTNYDGYKVFRVKTQGQLETVQQKLSSFDYEQWNHNVLDHIDLSLSPSQLAAFESLGLDYHCMHENLGASISTESKQSQQWKRQVEDLSWFDSYHSYDDHIQYFEDLHESFPDNSEMISSGTSYEGRDIFGVHLWGADGPGKTITS